MDPDRLSQLRRQRELIRQHLAWLDSEIAAASHTSPSPTPSPTDGADAPAQPASSSTDAAAPLPLAADSSNASGEDAAPLIPDPDPGSVHNEVRRGCLIYAGILAGLLAALIAFIYWRY